MKLKKTFISGITFALLASTSLSTSFAMPGMNSSSSSMTDGMQMSMGSDAATIMLKSNTQKGVKGMPHLKDIKEAMAQHGGEQTHHFMVQFSSDDGKNSLNTGMAALKIIDPDGNKLAPAKMMAMDGSFGVDVKLTKKGKYTFEVGTKFKDGKKRVFRFYYDNPDS